MLRQMYAFVPPTPDEQGSCSREIYLLTPLCSRWDVHKLKILPDFWNLLYGSRNFGSVGPTAAMFLKPARLGGAKQRTTQALGSGCRSDVPLHSDLQKPQLAPTGHQNMQGAQKGAYWCACGQASILYATGRAQGSPQARMRRIIMALSNLSSWTNETAPAASCGTACGAGDVPEAQSTACGTACGAGDAPAETPAAACGTGCGAGDPAPAACGTGCGAGDK